jgi:cyclophilin family peptidyl-prolyl cis-trans isomerase
MNFTKILAFVLLTFTLAACSKEETKPAADTSPMEQILEIKTPFGNMYMWLYKETPLHRANYLSLADTNYLDNSSFHRCVKNFVIQGGDPNSKDSDSTNDGTGGPNYTIPAEIDSAKLKHVYGAVGAARTNNPAKASNGSQFYIVVNKAGTASLDGQYTVFGKIIKGMEVAEQIVLQPQKASNNRPYIKITMDVNKLNKTQNQLKTEFNFTP